MPDSGIRIRIASSEDDVAIANLLIETYLRAYAKRLPDHRLHQERIEDFKDVAVRRSQGCVLVAEKFGQIIGTVSLQRMTSAQPAAWPTNTAEVKYLAVERDFQGSNLSKALLTEAYHVSNQWSADAMGAYLPRGSYGVARLFTQKGFVRKPECDREQHPEVFLEAYWKPLIF